MFATTNTVGEEYSPEGPGFLALLAGLDSSAGAAIFFAVLSLLCVVVCFVDHIAAQIVAVTGKLVLHPVKSCVRLASWLVMQLAAIRSPRELRTRLAVAKHRATRFLVDSMLAQFVASADRWFFPPHRPQDTVFRLFGTYIAGLTAYGVIHGTLMPYLSGFFGGWTSEYGDWSPYCLGMLNEYSDGVWLDTRQWSQAVYCLGEASGLELSAIIFEDLEFDRFLDSEFAFVLAFAVICVSPAIVRAFSIAASSDAPTERADSLSTEAENADGETRLFLTSLSPLVFRLWNVMADLDKIISQYKGIVAAKMEELRMAKQDAQGSRAIAKQLTDERDTAVQNRDALSSDLEVKLSRTLQQLAEARANLGQEEERANVRERLLSDKVSMLERQLSLRPAQVESKSLSEFETLRAELESVRARNDKLAAIEHRLAAAEARETEARNQNRQLDAKCQLFAAQNAELVAKVESDERRLPILEQRSQELAVECATFKKGYDDAVSQVIDLQRQLAATQEAADNKIRELQQELADANLKNTSLELDYEMLEAQFDDVQEQADVRLPMEIAELKQQLGVASIRLDQGQMREAQLSGTVENLKTQLSSQETQLEDKQV